MQKILSFKGLTIAATDVKAIFTIFKYLQNLFTHRRFFQLAQLTMR